MPADESPARRSRTPLSLAAIAWAAAAVASCTALAITFLVWPFPLITATTPTERLDALRTALAIGAGGGAAATLLLAGRRQVHLEEAAAATDADARERRITELYIKAVDQLGAGAAAVRLGGLHALERLAQDNPAHRQTVVDVVCSYLRMPFPVDEIAVYAGDGPEAAGPWIASFSGTAEQRQEIEVRMSAQSILLRHLRPTTDDCQPDDARYWPGMNLDLTSAVLIDFQLQRCRMASARFVRTAFAGRVRFYECVFEGSVEFDLAHFYAGAWFRRAEFHGSAWFSGTEFHGEFNLGGAHFYGPAMFGGRAWFGGTIFRHDVEFEGVAFDDVVELARARARVGPDRVGPRRTWPAGWMLDTSADDDGWAPVVRVSG